MPHVAQTYRYIPLQAYPHMRPGDVVIWNDFVTKYPNRFLRAWYDVRVGEPDVSAGDVSPVAMRSWWDLTRWQIDALCEDLHAFYVIEVKPNANAKAIGQALSYAKLWEEKRRPNKPVIPVVLTDRINPITQRCAEHCGVELWEV